MVAGSVGSLHLHGLAAPAASGRPVQLGTVPAPADCYRHRPSVDGRLAQGGSALLSGPAGTGKTQAAAHHVHLALQAGELDLVLWIDASSRAAILRAYALAAGRLGENAPAEEAPDRLLAWLNTTDRRWMVVLDGLASAGDLAELRPAPSATGRVLVTTRSSSQRLRMRRQSHVPVGHFTAAEALGFLGDRLAVHDLHAPAAELGTLAEGEEGHPGRLSALADRLVDLAAAPPPHPYGLRPGPAGPVHNRSAADCPLCAPPGAAGTAIALRYAPEDVVWARWVDAVLTRAGLRTVAEPSDAPETSTGGPRSGAPDRTVLLVSPASLRSPRPAPAPATGHVVVARIDGVSPLAAHREHPGVPLSGPDGARAAAALLDALGGAPHPPDLTGLRWPGSGAAHFKVPLRYPAFTGRREVLDRLHRRLGGGVAAVLPSSQSLVGLGGIGKTQIALEYAHRFKAEYDLIWWIDAEQPELIPAALANVARELRLPVGDSVTEASDAALAALRRGDPAERWLLVFDNADAPADIEPFLPGGSGHVLVTSRNPGWTSMAEAFAVDVFTRRESVEHLCRRAPSLTARDADRVADELGDLPLAVEVAAAWLNATGMPVDDYLVQLRIAASRVLLLDRPIGHPASVATTWSVSITRLRTEAPAAARLLQLCAFFAPEPIAMGLLYNEQMIEALARYDERIDGLLAVAEAIRAIGRYSLARVDAARRTVQLHRLVQAVIRSEMTEDEQRAARHDVHLVLAGARPADGDDAGPAQWPVIEEIWPHLGASGVETCDLPAPRQLMIDRVRYLWRRGDHRHADELSSALLSLWAGRLGEDDPQHLRLRFQRANVLRSLGRHGEALALDEAVLVGQRAVLGEQHRHTLMTAGSLAADLRCLGRFEDALTLDLDTYGQFLRLFGVRNDRTLAMGHNLAIDYRLVGDSQAALDLDRTTLEGRIAVLGPLHPWTLVTKYCVARDLRDLGDFPTSIQLLRESGEGFAGIQDPELPENLRNTSSLAVSLRRVGRLEEARAANAVTYERLLRRYGDHAPDTLICAINLAADHSAAGDNEAARALTVRVQAAHHRLFGPDHPFSLLCAANLALYLRTSGEAREAVERGEEVVAALRERVGAGHPLTLKAVINLANAHNDVGRHSDALALQRQATTALHARYGPDHPDVLVCTANLSLTLHALGHPDDAAALHTRALADLTRRLGPDHPDTLTARAHRPIDRDLESQPV
ncbi:FxSxx-COOH system tetratricopeptide repeat protein [Streptomyces sp. NRRL WC-3742]|uniref:FxSxx-COOH system tetratricopeptide repeat protein n=1 Tax=Streptomyces sp. NRRL WC-3742 TaxID=1463934 RepID=UPI00068E4E73|nr:FxSxx-COOH system tetratricopeptide repeat protein [Streptomyces sp. NRRL WC-3742]